MAVGDVNRGARGHEAAANTVALRSARFRSGMPVPEGPGGPARPGMVSAFSSTGRHAPAAPADFENAATAQLLASLPGQDLSRLLPQLQRVELRPGQILYESGSAVRHVFFPSTAIVSLLYVTRNGESAELAVVGNEGVVGVPLFMGGQTTLHRAVVQSAGAAYRMTASAAKEEFDQSAPVMHALLRYMQALISQVAQTAACNRHHSIEQQFCRWLLTNFDRVEQNELSVTQQHIADMLGVRREGVTEAACRVQRAGEIRYARGRISILDRPGLERRACECYAVVQGEYARLLPRCHAG